MFQGALHLSSQPAKTQQRADFLQINVDNIERLLLLLGEYDKYLKT